MNSAFIHFSSSTTGIDQLLSMELSLRPGHLIFFLLAALVEPAAVPSRRSAENLQTTGPRRWCANGSEVNTTVLKMKIKGDILQFIPFRQQLIAGEDSLKIPKVEGLTGGACDTITIPPYSVIHHNNDSQHMANILWNVQFLNELYKKTFKLIMICEYPTTRDNTTDHNVAKLTKMQVMIDSFIENTEDYLMAERCSCKHATCSIHQFQLSKETVKDQIRLQSHSVCTRMNFLGQVLRKIELNIKYADGKFNPILRGIRAPPKTLCQLHA